MCPSFEFQQFLRDKGCFWRGQEGKPIPRARKPTLDEVLKLRQHFLAVPINGCVE